MKKKNGLLGSKKKSIKTKTNKVVNLEHCEGLSEIKQQDRH